MTYLELVQDLVREAVGLSGSGPTTTSGQSGDMLRAVGWIDRAYEDIQNLRADWRFLRRDVSFTTAAAQQSYEPASDIGEWKRGSFRVYPTAAGVASETPMAEYEWDDFRATFLFGSTRTRQGRPTALGYGTDRSLLLWPIPDATGYTVVGEYYRAPHEMTADDDEPIMPTKYHRLIVWRALNFYAGHAASAETFAQAAQEYRRLLAMMRGTELERASW